MKHLWIIRSPWLCRLLAPFADYRWIYPIHEYVIAENKTSRSPALHAAWKGREPLLQITPEHQAAGEVALRAMGVPEGADFVCVHCREPSYRPGESCSDLRDANIATYLPAVEALLARGFWCIRLGDASGDEAARPASRAHRLRPYHSLRLRARNRDLFLMANCRFILGSASGPCQVATIFGRPAAAANQIPLSVVYSHGPDDLNLPKLIRRRQDGPS